MKRKETQLKFHTYRFKERRKKQIGRVWKLTAFSETAVIVLAFFLTIGIAPGTFSDLFGGKETEINADGTAPDRTSEIERDTYAEPVYENEQETEITDEKEETYDESVSDDVPENNESAEENMNQQPETGMPEETALPEETVLPEEPQSDGDSSEPAETEEPVSGEEITEDGSEQAEN